MQNRQHLCQSLLELKSQTFPDPEAGSFDHFDLVSGKLMSYIMLHWTEHQL